MPIPANAGWQRDLSVSHNKVGEVLHAQGDLAGALARVSGQPGNPRDAGAAPIPANAGWQRDLSVSHEKVGDVLGRKSICPARWRRIAASLAIRETLAARCGQCPVADRSGRFIQQVGEQKPTSTPEEKRAYLKQCLTILKRLQNEERLPPNQNWITWFEETLTEQDAANDV